MRHTLFVAPLSTLAGNSLFEVMKDWTLSGLVQETNWLDPRKPNELVSLGKDGVKKFETALWSSSMLRAEDKLDLFSIQLLIAKDGAIGPTDLSQALAHLGSPDSGFSRLVNLLFPTFGSSEGLGKSCLERHQNIVLSPTDSHSPTTGSLELAKKSHQYFQHAAKELSSMAGIWPGQTKRTIPEGNVALGNEDNIRLGRSFVRYVDASSLVDEITEEVLSVEQGLIPVAFDPENKSPLERVSSGESVSQVESVSKSFIDIFPELSYTAPRSERMKAPEKAGIIQAIKLYFKWVFGWLRKQPKQLLQGFIHKKKAELAGKVQALYGGEDSKIAVYFGDVTSHGGQEWNSFDVTRSIQEAGSKHSTVKLAPASPGLIWQTFFKTATALADGKEFSYQGSNPEKQLELPRFQKGGRRLISQPSHIVSDPKSSSFSIPVGLPLRISGRRLTSEDPLLCKLAVDEIRDVLTKDGEISASERTRLIELENDLDHWAKTNVSFSWLVGSALSEGIYKGLEEWHRGQEAINAKADDSKVAEAEEKAQAALKNLLKGGLAITLSALGVLAGVAIWSFIATGALPVIGATWWIPVLIFSSIFAIWNLLAATVLRGAIKEYFVLDNNLAVAANQYEKARRQQSQIWGEIHRLTSFYQQYMYWCRILAPVIHRTQSTEARKTRTSVIDAVHKLPAAMSVAKLMPNEGNSGDMTAQVRRDFYKPGWIEDGFTRVIRGLDVDLTALYADDANLAIGPLAKLSNLMSDSAQVSRRFEEDASARVQQISTSGPSYQQWRVEPLGMIGQPGVDSGATFILDLAKGTRQVPDGNLLGARGKVSGSNELDDNLTYIAADSRIDITPEFERINFERISHNPLHPLDFLGVRVELSKPFNSGLFRTEATDAQESDQPEEPEAPEA
jgi:hypothetical protein